MSDSEIVRLVEEDHRRLRQREAELESELARRLPPDGFTEWKRRFLQQLRHFQHCLLQHFDLEEDCGFISDLLLQAPRLSNRANALEKEHEDLAERLASVIAEVKHSKTLADWDGAGIPSRIIALLDALKEHEASDHSLIQEAYFQDIGVAG